MLAIGGARGLAKVFAFGAQLVLGWILCKGDYKLWAMASSCLIFVSGLRDGGVQRLIIHEGRGDPEKIRSIVQFCWIMVIVSAVALLCGAPVATAYFKNPAVAEIVVLLAIVVVTCAPLTAGAGRLALALRFKEQALIDTIQGFVRYSSMIAFALLGYGVKSFVYPEIITNLVGCLLFSRFLGRVPAGPSVSWQRLKDIWHNAKWLIAASFAASLALSGDYLIIGRYHQTVLADYYFGFQLAMSISVLFAPAIQIVLLPTFNRLNDQPVRQASAYEKTVNLASLLAAPMCIAMFVLAPPLISLAWSNGKWDAAAPVVQIMAINLMFRLLSPLAFSMMQAHGRWQLYAGCLLAEGALVVIAAAIGTNLGGLVPLTICIAFFRSALPFVALYLAAKTAGAPGMSICVKLMYRAIVFSAAGGVITLAARQFNILSPWHELAIRAVLLLLVLAGLCMTIFRDEYANAYERIAKLRHSQKPLQPS